MAGNVVHDTCSTLPVTYGPACKDPRQVIASAESHHASRIVSVMFDNHVSIAILEGALVMYLTSSVSSLACSLSSNDQQR